MYAIVDDTISKCEIVKENKKGTAAWCKLNGFTKNKLISYTKIFITKEEAFYELDKKSLAKKQRKKTLEVEINEIGKILDKIFHDFNIEVKALDRPESLEDAKILYNKLKEQSE